MNINIKLILFGFSLVLSNCPYGTEKGSPSKSIDLLNGPIILCSGEKFGEVIFDSSCSLKTEQVFDLAISLLHSFEYSEAEKAFATVLDLGPNCAMAHLGVAMSSYRPFGPPPTLGELEKGSKALGIASSLQMNGKERNYCLALHSYYYNWEFINHYQRLVNYEKAMAYLFEKYPDDVEVAIFYALALIGASDPNDKTFVKRKKAANILMPLLVENPNHPGIAHYIIHCYDLPELAVLALEQAHKFAEIAPASAHALHIPSHIFNRLGYWEESIESNKAAVKAAQCYSGEMKMDGHWAAEIHALDFQIYGYLQLGEYRQAIDLANYVAGINKIIPKTDVYNYAASIVRPLWELKNWCDAESLEFPQINIQWVDYPMEFSIFYYTIAVGAAFVGNVDRCRVALLALDENANILWLAGEFSNSDQVRIQYLNAKACLAFMKGKKRDAFLICERALALEASYGVYPQSPGRLIPSAELYGDLLFMNGDYEKALILYESSLESYPGRMNSKKGMAFCRDSMVHHNFLGVP